VHFTVQESFPAHNIIPYVAKAQ